MSQFVFQGMANIQHINARKEGSQDDKELAVDLKFEAVTNHEICDFFDPDLAGFLFNNIGAVKNIFLDPIAYSHKLMHYMLKIREEMVFSGVEVKDLTLEPKDGSLIHIKFKCSIKPMGLEVARLAEYLQNEVSILLEPENMELELEN